MQQLIDEVQKEIEDFKLKINYNFEDEEDADAKHNSFERPKSTIKDKFIDITPCEDKKSESIQNSPRSFDKDMSERKSQEI